MEEATCGVLRHSGHNGGGDAWWALHGRVLLPESGDELAATG
uniref:Uncharacterized protein n=1 Tax=Arundo donax TaxID=35708 RepID=A0A0A9AJA1_ARUDO